MDSTPNQTGTAVSIGAAAFHALRQALHRSIGDDAAAVLQEAGHATGNDLYDRFTSWLPAHAGLDDPAELDAEHLGEVLSSFLGTLGWGAFAMERLGEAGVLLTSSNWIEADPAAGSAHPSCNFSAGMLSAFLSQMADDAIAVLEVACRSQNGDRCVFLVGSQETLQTVRNGMMAGREYSNILTS